MSRDAQHLLQLVSVAANALLADHTRSEVRACSPTTSHRRRDLRMDASSDGTQITGSRHPPSAGELASQTDRSRMR